MPAPRSIYLIAQAKAKHRHGACRGDCRSPAISLALPVHQGFEYDGIVSIGTGDCQRQRDTAPSYDEMVFAAEFVLRSVGFGSVCGGLPLLRH